MVMRSGATLALLMVLGLTGCTAQARYLGWELGALTELHHGVRGRVFAVDARTLFIQDFHYDGEGPAAFFYVGSSKTPSASGGLRLRDEKGGAGPLRRYRGEGVTLALPEGKTLRDVSWFSVWCDEYSVNFGDVKIPRDIDYPRPAKVGALHGVHGVSSDPVVVVDAQTLLVPNFSYDGEAPDAKFWVGRGEKPSPQGIRIPDENGKEAPLRKYDKKTIVLTLPGELTVFDIGHFGVWCEAFTVNFGHVSLPRAALNNVPPSLKMLGVSPQSKLNCEVLFDELAFEVRWAVAGDSIVLQLVAKLEDGEYMSFGISGAGEHSQMVGGDVAVAWVDKQTLKGYAQDYYLDAKSQCAGVRGSCPDERLGEKTNSIRLLNAALVNGYSIVTYQRSLKAADELDRAVLTNASQPIIWALGPLNSRNEVSYHHHFTKGDKFIEFGRPPVWNCPMPEGEGDMPAVEPAREVIKRPTSETGVIIKPNPVPTPKPVPAIVPWDIPAIQCYEPPDGVLYAQMGATGGKQGYSAITGHVGWGISWFINGLLIPEINVVRGKKYTFVVEGGSDPDTPARYHPFYITNDPVGGFFHKTDEEKKGVEIYAGVRRARNGELIPTGVGRLCNWTPDASGPEADEFPSFGAYQRSLTLVCEEGNPGVVTWIPDKNTPDTVYYQCFTHRYLGGKINVMDECDATEGEESRVVQSISLPDLMQEESIKVQSRVKPDANFLDERRKFQKIINTKNNDFSSDKDDILTGEIYRPEPEKNQLHQYQQEYELPVSKDQIRNVIETVESLETRAKETKRNATPRVPQQYQVTEDVRELFQPEMPVRDDDEYVLEPNKLPNNYFLPPSHQPLTLQSVLRPNKPNNTRPQYRRPAPPEIRLRRPPPMYQKHNNFPLPMPNPHGSHFMQKKPYNNKQFTRLSPNMNIMNRPPQSGIPPMKAMPPLPSYHPKSSYNQSPPKQITKPSGSIQSIIIGKPTPTNNPLQSQKLSLGRTDIIGNHVVKSQITLPGNLDAIAQPTMPQIYVNAPGQIILGKPMDNPVPLDQQMTPTKHHNVRISPTPPPEPHSTTLRIRTPSAQPHPHDEIKLSDFMGEHPDPTPLPPAVNTGFSPNTIVIESGFKPIIREPLMDRVGDYDDFNNSNINRREDTDVEEDYEESPQFISNHAYNTPSHKITETFEPMFIPSPPDHIIATNDRTKEIFPSNHAKEDRPHPVYVKTESELNALFSKQNMKKEVPDMVMESDRVSPQYLPPDPKLPKEHSQKLATNEETFTTYDGKTVSAATLTNVPDVKIGSAPKIFSSKLPSTSELLLKTPQFGPFKGEIPSLDAVQSSKPHKTPQFGPFKGDIPPLDTVQSSNPHKDTRTTHLKLVEIYKPDDAEDEFKTEASEKREVKGEKNDEHIDDIREYEDDDEDDEEEESKLRNKRETKTTQFERGEVELQTQPNRVSEDKSSQSDFIPVKSRSTKLYWTKYVVLLSLCLKFF